MRPRADSTVPGGVCSDFVRGGQCGKFREKDPWQMLSCSQVSVRHRDRAQSLWRTTEQPGREREVSLVATVYLSCEEATTTGLVPALCMQCGQPSSTVTWRSFSNGGQVPFFAPVPDGPIGCVGAVLVPFILFCQFMAWLSTRSMKVLVPYCAEHAKRGWFTSDPLTVEEITASGISLSGVADAYARALTQMRRGPSLSRYQGRIRP